ncbi:MAG: symmetrical bis(5'-nucleosyl)-tetraphosphatase [Deltaproteobacteria bacterium]|nr:symmetrical bis(5'-nucleosyl)-tetraphosphatase [Deltaproteobacteria bacterium]
MARAVATYVIGDIQGCHAALVQLLARIEFDRARDRLWLVGDLVNRGPASLPVLRFFVAHRDVTTAVLGNHELYLLGRAAGAVPRSRDDTLDEVFAAADVDALVDVVRHLPVVAGDATHLLVHAGFHPTWTRETIVAEARAIEAALRGPDWRAFIALYFKRPRPPWSPDLEPLSRAAAALQIMTRIRFVGPDQAPVEGSGPPELAPEGTRPWFRAPAWRAPAGVTIVHGHWASLGLWITADHVALDSGCVWGGLLTALRLDDRAVFAVSGRIDD